MENAASIVSMFGQALVTEFQEIRGVGDKIVHLRDELASMNAVLRMLAEADEDCVDHLVREWTKQVRELASDSEDCVDIYKLRVRRLLPRPPVDPGAPLNCARLLLGHARLLPGNVWLQFRKLFLKRSLAADLQALLARMVIISERGARYGVNREALRRSAAVSPVTLSARALRPANDPEQFFGLAGQVDKLAKRLRSGDDDQDMRVKVFSIVGFGGLGKTTLAMEVCRELEEDFQYQAQVSVSQAFDAGKDLEGLLKRMLHQMMIKRQPDDKGGAKEGTSKVDPTDGMDVPELTNALQDLLRDKRMDVAEMSRQIAYENVLAERHRGMMTRLQAWLKSSDEANAAMADFSQYYILEEPSDGKEKKAFRRLVKEKEKKVDELRENEDACRHSLEMEIGFSVSKEEFQELDLWRPEQVIGWVIKQGVSEDPARRARWCWFRETKDVLMHWAGSADFQLKRNLERDEQTKRIIRFRDMFPV